MACPGELVVDIAGDGSIQMNIQELATAVQCGLPVKVVILNNCYLGMVRQWQELFYEKRYACTCMAGQPDFVKLAEAYGATGLRATRPDEVEDVLRRGIETPGPVIMKRAFIPWFRPERRSLKCCSYKAAKSNGSNLGTNQTKTFQRKKWTDHGRRTPYIHYAGGQ